jgi:hypothetical protein
MVTNSKSGFKIHRKKIAIVFLLLVVLFVSLFVYTLTTMDSVAPDLESVVYVNTESDLKTAINNATHDIPVVIAFDCDITLKETIHIPANKDITLTSNSSTKFYKLIAANAASVKIMHTIVVEGGGTLKLDGIIVTHQTGKQGIGVIIDGGKFVLYNGVITGNTGYDYGGGVSNRGTFSMYGGEIYDNAAPHGGGGVYNGGDFTMFGGKIYKNKSIAPGDLAFGDGGGVCNDGTFKLVDGEISDNTAQHAGGGVYNNGGVFEMFGGKIYSNKAGDKGGGVHSYSMFGAHGAVFTMYDGVISNNAAKIGGGLCIDSKFDMFNGTISDNKATFSGGGVYIGFGIVNVTGGNISGNKASDNGGGICVGTKDLVGLIVSDGVIFCDNSASVAHSRAPEYAEVYNTNIGKSVVWTTPFTQGYNNYDIGIEVRTS